MAVLSSLAAAPSGHFPEIRPACRMLQGAHQTVSGLAKHDARGITAVAIAPDLGERYLDTVYQSNWVRDLYGEDVFESEELTAGSRSS